MLDIVNTKNIIGLRTKTGWEVTMFLQSSWNYHIRLEHEGYERDLRLGRLKHNKGYEMLYGNFKVYLSRNTMRTPMDMLTNIEKLIG